MESSADAYPFSCAAIVISRGDLKAACGLKAGFNIARKKPQLYLDQGHGRLSIFTSLRTMIVKRLAFDRFYTLNLPFRVVSSGVSKDSSDKIACGGCFDILVDSCAIRVTLSLYAAGDNKFISRTDPITARNPCNTYFALLENDLESEKLLVIVNRRLYHSSQS